MYLLIEIIFKLSNCEKLKSFFNNVITFEFDEVIRSHFYDDADDCNLEYSDMNDFCEFTLANSIESSLFLSSANCGIKFKRVVVLIAHDINGVTISLSVNKSDFNPTKEDCVDLVRHLLSSISSDIVGNIMLGFDPAEDDDMQITAFRKHKDYNVEMEADKLYTELNRFD